MRFFAGASHHRYIFIMQDVLIKYTVTTPLEIHAAEDLAGLQDTSYVKKGHTDFQNGSTQI